MITALYRYEDKISCKPCLRSEIGDDLQGEIEEGLCVKIPSAEIQDEDLVCGECGDRIKVLVTAQQDQEVSDQDEEEIYSDLRSQFSLTKAEKAAEASAARLAQKAAEGEFLSEEEIEEKAEKEEAVRKPLEFTYLAHILKDEPSDKDGSEPKKPVTHTKITQSLKAPKAPRPSKAKPVQETQDADPIEQLWYEIGRAAILQRSLRQ